MKVLTQLVEGVLTQLVEDVSTQLVDEVLTQLAENEGLITTCRRSLKMKF